MVIKGEADMMAYVGSATSKWDSCAGESIIKAMGGNFTTPLGNQISYDPNESLSNREGIFCSFDKEVHNKSIEFIKGLKLDLWVKNFCLNKTDIFTIFKVNSQINIIKSTCIAC